VPAVVLLQQAEIVVRVVEDDFDVAILEQVAEERRRPNRNGIDDRRSLACGELEQVDSIDESVEARALGIERENSCIGDGCGDGCEERVDGGRRVEVDGGVHVRNLTGTQVARSQRA
jgi:hypothetical protein